MTTVADTIKAALDAGWSEGTEPSYYSSEDHRRRPANGEYIYFDSTREQPRRKSVNDKYSTVTTAVYIESYTNTSKDRLDAIVTEVRTLTNGLYPATYDFIEVTDVVHTNTQVVRQRFGATLRVEVTTLMEAKT